MKTCRTFNFRQTTVHHCIIFGEATGGLARLKMDELAKSIKVKNAYTIRIDPNTNIALDSTIGAVGLNGSVWDWYSNDTSSDPRNSLSVFLAEVRNSETHLMLHDDGEPGVLTQTSGGTTGEYNYNGIPGDDNDASARGVILKYKATAERTLLIETAGGEIIIQWLLYSLRHIWIMGKSPLRL